MSRPRVHPIIWAIGLSLAALGFCSVSGCGDDPDAPPPPIGNPPGSSESSLPTIEESTGEPDPCAWDGTCAALEVVDECNGWAVACGDGFVCIDTMAERGIVCVADGSSSGGEESSDAT